MTVFTTVNRDSPAWLSSLSTGGHGEHAAWSVERRHETRKHVPPDNGVATSRRQHLHVQEALTGYLEGAVIEKRFSMASVEASGANDPHRRDIELGDHVFRQSADVRATIDLAFDEPRFVTER